MNSAFLSGLIAGLIIGLFVGANLGFLILALCRSASKGDQLMREALEKKGEQVS